MKEGRIGGAKGTAASLAGDDAGLLQLIVDRAEVSDLPVRHARALDLRDWDLLHSCFGDEVYVDYHELTGETLGTVKVDDFVGFVGRTLEGIKTQHLSTNHSTNVEGDRATCVSYMLAQHYLPNDRGADSYVNHGYYTYAMERTRQGWKVTSITMSVFWSDGNSGLFGLPR